MNISPYKYDWKRIFYLIIKPNLSLKKFSPSSVEFPKKGIKIFNKLVDESKCEKIKEDYKNFEKLCYKKKLSFKDIDGRNYRLANFHLKSKTLLETGLSETTSKFTTEFLGRTSSIYTSLYFKFGSQQKFHIDVPYFWTNPSNKFVGLWIALEDVTEDSGPLTYISESHKIFEDEDRLFFYFKKSKGDLSIMFDSMKEDCLKSGTIEKVIAKKGDAIIWHPSLMHGGEKAINKKKTRQSVVFHLSTVGTNVKDEKNFLNKHLNLPSYGVRSINGKYFSQVKLPFFMST